MWKATLHQFIQTEINAEYTRITTLRQFWIKKQKGGLHAESLFGVK